MSVDTPETVAEKMAPIGMIVAMMTHYLVEQHDGDYFDCECARIGDDDEAS